jgi:hypothetical protein
MHAQFTQLDDDNSCMGSEVVRWVANLVLGFPSPLAATFDANTSLQQLLCSSLAQVWSRCTMFVCVLSQPNPKECATHSAGMQLIAHQFNHQFIHA